MTRVGDLSERLDQGQRHPRDRLAVEAGLRLIEGGNDRGHLQCGHGFPDVVKDFDTLMITSGPCPSLHPLTSVAAGQLPLIATLPQPWATSHTGTGDGPWGLVPHPADGDGLGGTDPLGHRAPTDVRVGPQSVETFSGGPTK